MVTDRQRGLPARMGVLLALTPSPSIPVANAGTDSDGDETSDAGQAAEEHLELAGLDTTILFKKPPEVTCEEFVNYALRLNGEEYQAVLDCDTIPQGMYQQYESRDPGEEQAFVVDIILRANRDVEDLDETLKLDFTMTRVAGGEDTEVAAYFARRWLDLASSERETIAEENHYCV